MADAVNLLELEASGKALLKAGKAGRSDAAVGTAMQHQRRHEHVAR